MQDYKYQCAAVTICVTLVYIHRTYTHRLTTLYEYRLQLSKNVTYIHSEPQASVPRGVE